jgi:secreted PhoX family phosphatase
VQEIRLENGRWQLVRPSRYARRIHANTPMRVGGPAAGSALMKTASSPDGRASFGTFNNCANGWTPWGTYLTCEENFSFHFKAPPDPTALEERYELSPKVRFSFRWGEADPRFDMVRNRNEANHFGWVVEIDPFDPASVPVKRTALGRFSHEGATTVVCPDGRVAIYSGDDRTFEYLYKFVSARAWNPDRAANRDLLDEGTLVRRPLQCRRQRRVGRADPWQERADRGQWLRVAGAVVMYARAAGDLVGATQDGPSRVGRASPAHRRHVLTLTNNALARHARA